MSDETTIPAEVTEAVEEVKGSFDLGALIKGRPVRYKSVKVYTDEVLGEMLGGAEDERNNLGMVAGRRRWGLLGEADALGAELKVLEAYEEPAEDVKARIDEISARLIEIRDEVNDILEQMEASSLTIELQSLPPIINKDAQRKARQELGIKGNVPADRTQEYVDEYNAQVLSRAIVSITNGVGEKNTTISVQDARDLYGFLPASEVQKLDAIVDEVVFKSAIAKSLSTDADFSQGI